MSTISDYEAEAKVILHDTARMIVARYCDFLDDDRLTDTDAYKAIAPCLNYLNRLIDEYNSLLGSSPAKLSFEDLFGKNLTELFRYYREDCGIVASGEDSTTFLPSYNLRSATNNNEYWFNREDYWCDVDDMPEADDFLYE